MYDGGLTPSVSARDNSLFYALLHSCLRCCQLRLGCIAYEKAGLLGIRLR